MSETMVRERRDTLPSRPVRESSMPPYHYQDGKGGGGGSLSSGDRKADSKSLKGVNLAL
jgi:hypothetical protein